MDTRYILRETAQADTCDKVTDIFPPTLSEIHGFSNPVTLTYPLY